VRGTALIVNPSASRVTPELTAAVERELAAVGPVRVLLTERPAHATELAEAVNGTSDAIYVFSGDGVFNEVVNGLANDVDVGFVPGGGTSVLPRALGLPRDPVECARALARSQKTRRISLGRVNGRRFTFSAGLGLDAELVRRVDALGRQSGRRPGDLAFMATLARLLAAHGGRFEETLTILGRSRAAFALVANGDPYSYLGRLPIHVAPDARFELGLDLVAPITLSARQFPRVAFWLLARPNHTRAPWITHVHDADEIRIECDGPTPLQVDGEDLGDVTDAHFESERGVLNVLVG
jgi:diacylglycerol kinase family enzyme